MPEKLSDEEILEKLKALNGWEFREKSIKKCYKTASYPVTMGFITAIGGVAQRLNHHPDYILMKYMEIEVSFSTHSAGGVTQKDIDIAIEIDKINIR
ncbi:MAG: 4a-hydroxytetrahydrobiopterin dehydratase [Ignavibacteriae bacterium]|nr:MAG: 4a-hydroxytetrahydrobiopterin dehydratase [Ignavibacteriota bacterium]